MESHEQRQRSSSGSAKRTPKTRTTSSTKSETVRESRGSKVITASKSIGNIVE